MSIKSFKTNQLPESFAKLRKPGFYILDNTTQKVYILPDGNPAVFKLREEAEQYVIDNNISGIVK